MIYLAIPYSGMEELSFEISCMITAFLMKTGKTVYSPIVHGHILATKYDLPADREFWLKHDLDVLRRCDELCVVALDGWDESVGVLAEIEPTPVIAGSRKTLAKVMKDDVEPELERGP